MSLVVVSLSANHLAILPLVVAPVASAVRETGSESEVLATVMVAIVVLLLVLMSTLGLLAPITAATWFARSNKNAFWPGMVISC
jgi:hypothetical protein